MIQARHQSSKKPLFLIVLLSLALFCGQSVQFHSHSKNHTDSNEHTHGDIAMHADHDHAPYKHLSIDTSHADDHDLASVKMEDASPDTLFGQMSKKVSSIVFIVLLIPLIPIGTLLFKGIAHRRDQLLLFKPPIYFVPLLRAPPQ